MNHSRSLFMLMLSVVLCGCFWTTSQPSCFAASPKPPFFSEPVKPGMIRYIAVGDSYTCGTGASPSQSWPSILAAKLRSNGIPVGLALDTGVDGLTTQQARDVELPAFKASHPQFASLMIGVNDTYRPTSPQEFDHELTQVIDGMLKALPGPNRLFLVTIPDYAVTPSGSQFSNMNNAARKVIAFNQIIMSEGNKRHIPVVDVYKLSETLSTQSTMVAGDQLHPSANQYKAWADKVYPVAYRLLKHHK